MKLPYCHYNSVSITHHSKIRELSNWNKNWKHIQTHYSAMGPTSFDLWVMETELSVMEIENPNSPWEWEWRVFESECLKVWGAVWYMHLNTYFRFLNNIIHIFTHFFTHMYFQKIQTMLLEQCYQTAHECLKVWVFERESDEWGLDFRFWVVRNWVSVTLVL